MILRQTRRDEPQINVTPMIDIMIFLIVFFLAATQFTQKEREHDIQLPETRGTGSLSKALDKNLVINVKKDGTVFVDGKHYGLDEVTAIVASRRSAIGAGFKVKVHPDKRTSYQSIAEVLTLVEKAGVHGLLFDTKQESFEP